MDVLTQSCTAALSDDDDTLPYDTEPLPLILADIDGLLALLYTTSTKLSLASTSTSIINDLAQHTTALAHATRLLRAHLHGATLVKHVTDRVHDIIDALRALAQSLIDNPTSDDYLVKTGTLHDLITNARNPSGIPKDNQTAVYLAWKLDRESLDDNLQEVTRIISDAEGDHLPTDDLVDGWDEIGLGNAQKLDEHEIARANNVHHLLRLTTLLHKRIFSDLLAFASSAPISAFDSLLSQSNLLLSTSDDLVAALYSPQDPDHIRNIVLDIPPVATYLQTQVITLLPLANQLNALDVHSDNIPISKKKADKKWFETCIYQITRLSTSICESLSARPDGPT